MISSGLFRPSFKITIADIFQDYNDPRKQQLTRRVEIALEEQERRLKHEVESNNLANLQIMLKKQQILKKMEENLKAKDEEIEEIKIKLSFSNCKISELQKQLSRYHQLSKVSDQKLNTLTGSLKQLETIVKSKQSLHKDLQHEKQSLLSQNERLEEEKRKYEHLINNLRNIYNQKMEESQYVLKIRQKKMEDQFEENLEHFKNQKEMEKSRNQIQNKIELIKKETKNQKIQCNFLAKESPRKVEPQKDEKSIQTEQTQQKNLSELIDKNKKDFEIQPNLDEVRLIYTTAVREISLPEPKLTRYISLIQEDKEIQTIEQHPATPSPRKIIIPPPSIMESQQIQVNMYIEDKTLKDKLKKEKQKNDNLIKEQKTSIAEIQLLNKQILQLKNNIQSLNLKIMELEIEIDKKNHSMSVERQMLTRVNRQLQSSQNELMIRKLSFKTDFGSKKSHFSQTCQIMHPKHSHKLSFGERQQKTMAKSTQEEPKQFEEDVIQGGGLDSVQFLSPRKWAEEEKDVITIIRKANHLKSFKSKRHSITQEAQSQGKSLFGSSFMKQKYRKFSQIKRF